MRRTCKAKEKLKNGEPILASFLAISDSVVAEVMAMSGIDLIIIDNEHMAFDDKDIQNICRAVQLRGATCILRTAIKDVMTLTKYMALGVDGFCATQMSTVEEAKALVRATKFPPLGERGMCNVSMGNQYGVDGMPMGDTMAYGDDNTFLMVVVEDEIGANNVAEIVALPGIDTVNVGAGDMSASMGFKADGSAPAVQVLVQKAHKAITAAGKYYENFANSPEEVKALVAKGERFIIIGTDLKILRDAYLGFARALK